MEKQKFFVFISILSIVQKDSLMMTVPDKKINSFNTLAWFDYII